MDQLFSSFTNFAITGIVVHEVRPAEFGAFSLALTLYICFLWVCRSVVGEPYIVRLTTASEQAKTDGGRQALGTAAVLGSTAAVLMIAGGLVSAEPAGPTLATMGIFMPVLLVQDSYRYILMARGKVKAAAANDFLWLFSQSALAASFIIGHSASATFLVIAFGSGAAAGAILGAYQTHIFPRPSQCVHWLKRQRDLWVPFLVELLAVNATPQLSLLLDGALGGILVVGALRTGIFLFAPLTVLFSGLYLVALPEAARLRQRSIDSLRSLVFGLGLGMTVLTGCWAMGLWLVPARIGTALLGANWQVGHNLIWETAGFTGATSLTLAAIVGLRALQAARKSLRARIWAGPIILGSSVVGASLGGVQGAAIGLALSCAFSAVLTCTVLFRELGRAPVDEGDLDISTLAVTAE